MSATTRQPAPPKPPRILGRCDALLRDGTQGYVHCDQPATHTHYGHLLCPKCFEMREGGRVLGPGRVQTDASGSSNAQ